MHIYISKLSIIGCDSGLSPGGCQAIIWTNVENYGECQILRILLIWPLGTEIQWNTYWNSYIFIQENVYEMLAILSRLNVLTQ